MQSPACANDDLGPYLQNVIWTGYSPLFSRAHVLTIRDLVVLTSEPAVSSSADLLRVWDENWPGLGKNDASAHLISAGIDQLRNDVLSVLAALD